MTYLTLPVEDTEVKDQAELILNDLGISIEASFNMFLKAIVREQGLPLSVNLDSYDTTVLKMLQEAEADENSQLHDVNDVLSMMTKIIEGNDHV